MNTFEGVGQAMALIPQALKLTERLISMLRAFNVLVARSIGILSPKFSYENDSLSLTLDLLASGKKAVVLRKQKVRFLTAEAGIVTNPVWGEGHQLADFKVNGARLVGSRREGAVSVLLLALNRRPDKGSIAEVTSTRTVL